MLSGQADQARRVIPKSWDVPPRADGVYAPGGGPVERWHRGVPFDLHLMVFGDSTATGRTAPWRRRSAWCADRPRVGRTVRQADPAEHQGDRRRVVERLVRPDRRHVRDRPIAGCRGDHDPGQRHHQAEWDRTVCTPAGQGGPATAGQRRRRRGRYMSRLRPRQGDPAAASMVARSRACGWRARRPARCGRRAAFQFRSPTCRPPSSGGARTAVSDDMFHPSGAGYELAAKQLLPALCNALGEHISGGDPEMPLESRTADVPALLSRLGGVSRLWRRSTGVPAPIVVRAG